MRRSCCAAGAPKRREADNGGQKACNVYTRDALGRETAERVPESLSFLYRTLPGRLCLSVLTQPALSRLAGAYLSSPLSRGLIDGFIRKNGIDMRDYEKRDYESFNDFFTAASGPAAVRSTPTAGADRARRRAAERVCDRRQKPVFHQGDAVFGRHAAARPRAGGAPFRGGLCLIFRLTVGDYHRYCFFDDGVVLGGRFLPGVLHTVNPVALGGYDIYKENARAVTLLRTRSFGDAAQVEVGAMLVGRICNTHTSGFFFRGQEKGYFEYGGSTVVLLLRHGAAELRRDILRNTADGVETRVRQGERIGNAKRK